MWFLKLFGIKDFHPSQVRTITVTDLILAGTPIYINTESRRYDINGHIVELGRSFVDFIAISSIQIYLNDKFLNKTLDIVRLSSCSFHLFQDLHAGDEIQIFN